MSTQGLILPTHLTGSRQLPRYKEHEHAIQILCRLRNKYPPNSPEWRALNANSETINRLGGRVVTSTGTRLIENIDDSRKLAFDGYCKAAGYLQDVE